MKRVVLLWTLLMTVLMVVAVPAKRGVWRTLTLENGAEVRAQLVGDEHGHFWCADDGRTYRMKANGIAQTVDANKIIAKAKSPDSR